MLQFASSALKSARQYGPALAAAIAVTHRLEVDPAGESYDEALAARVADPLWMIGRQWQFREFDGEDAGSPLEVRWRMQGTRLLGYAPGRTPAAAAFTRLGDVPLEARVEAEPVFDAPQPHRRAMAEAGRHLARLAVDAGQPAVADQARAAFPLALPAPADPPSDPAGMLWHLFLDGRAVNAGALRAALRPQRQSDGSLSAVPAALAAQGTTAAALPVLAEWLAWAEDHLFEGDGAAWLPGHLEYAFELAAGRDLPGAPIPGRLRLDAQEYVDGRVDWHDFDLRFGEPTLMPGMAPPLDDTADRRSFATPIQYPGMPASRFWEFEDARVNFARVDAAKLDLVRMMVAEYALVHGNDWFMVPVRLRAGALWRVATLQVTDTFGVVTNVAPASTAGDDVRWRLHGLTPRAPDGSPGQADGHWLFLPPPLSDTLEGEPLEEVAFARDEMANLVWAIEKRVQGTSGEPLDRAREDQRYAFRQQPTAAASAAPLLYRLTTVVPSHWLPLLPARDKGDLSLDIHLLRGGMKRFYRKDQVALNTVPGLEEFLELLRTSRDFVRELPPSDPARLQDLAVFEFHPRGVLLRTDPSQDPWAEPALRIAEEEVGREGLVVERRFQYARTADGRAVLWVGRRRRLGRGEASSGLRFDVAVRQGQR
jgi:hypothetical protein